MAANEAFEAHEVDVHGHRAVYRTAGSGPARPGTGSGIAFSAMLTRNGALNQMLEAIGLGFLRQDFYRDPVWTWQRTAIVSAFLFCAGLLRKSAR